MNSNKVRDIIEQKEHGQLDPNARIMHFAQKWIFDGEPKMQHLLEYISRTNSKRIDKYKPTDETLCFRLYSRRFSADGELQGGEFNQTPVIYVGQKVARAQIEQMPDDDIDSLLREMNKLENDHESAVLHIWSGKYFPMTKGALTLEEALERKEIMTKGVTPLSVVIKNGNYDL